MATARRVLDLHDGSVSFHGLSRIVDRIREDPTLLDAGTSGAIRDRIVHMATDKNAYVPHGNH